MAKAFLVVRIKGQVDVPHWAKTTLKLLKLEKKFRATIIPAKENTLGMLNKKGRKSGYKKITQDDIKEIGFNSIDELANSLAEGQTSLTKLKPLKPWFALSPPRHGFKRSTKKMYGEKGVLGQNKELGALVKNMM